MNIIGILTFSNGEKIRFKARRKGTHKNKCRSCLFSPKKTIGSACFVKKFTDHSVKMSFLKGFEHEITFLIQNHGERRKNEK